MRANKRIQLKRKPLSDSTNHIVSTPSPQNPKPLRNSNPSVIEKCELSGPSTVYTRRRRRADEGERGDAAAGFLLRGLSTIPQIANIGKPEDEDGDLGLSEPRKDLQKKKQRRALLEQDASEDYLNGYFEQQRVYFEAVDAEELEEEVESDTEDACTERTDNRMNSIT